MNDDYNQLFFDLLKVAVALTIGFLFGSYYQEKLILKQQSGLIKNCSIESGFGPKGEVVLIEDIELKRNCVNTDIATSYCVLGLYDTAEQAKIDAIKKHCVFKTDK